MTERFYDTARNLPVVYEAPERPRNPRRRRAALAGVGIAIVGIVIAMAAKSGAAAVWPLITVLPCLAMLAMCMQSRFTRDSAGPTQPE